MLCLTPTVRDCLDKEKNKFANSVNLFHNNALEAFVCQNSEYCDFQTISCHLPIFCKKIGWYGDNF